MLTKLTTCTLPAIFTQIGRLLLEGLDRVAELVCIGVRFALHFEKPRDGAIDGEYLLFIAAALGHAVDELEWIGALGAEDKLNAVVVDVVDEGNETPKAVGILQADDWHITHDDYVEHLAEMDIIHGATGLFAQEGERGVQYASSATFQDDLTAQDLDSDPLERII